MDFCIEGDNIRYGLTSIKGISDRTIEKLNNFRGEFSNKFEVFQAASEAKVGIGVLSALIQAGAFEGFPQSRSKIVLEAQLWNILTQREKRIAYNLGEKFEFDLIYVKNNNLFLDSKILLITFYQLLHRKNISSRNHATTEKFSGNE